MAANKQIILVTGANAGIGYDTSYALAAASPDNHVIMGARNQARGEKALKELQARKPQGTLSLVVLDVTSDDSIEAAAAKIEADFGRLDVLVNNAGIGNNNPVTREVLRTSFDTNVFGVLLLSNALTPLLKLSKSPKIINVSSEMGSIAAKLDPTNPWSKVPVEVYRMTKAALNMLTACQYVDLKEFGVKAWSFCPGYVVTDIGGDREFRKSQGADSSETSAQGILEIVEGKRDAEVGKFLGRYGKQIPW
ncbi:short-chain dehydrogenase [Colletotrichum tofieldiae]|uniref:Short-chain dehydrogenase n=1 Tax=Colletotrichum tofieldiae TaxID=708197 RepID=A0A161VW98_9PEZI|nr:short-chain dehydrogenase [Colletotrichum tofieldiae]GKT61785.1 short-chain dehydrogenase [Colletotrichum tofieldiae]GKT70160.1 short-chain dehydrogenase [Colletotrichum tofieldiae]GKT93205.1 short-chain dehydrogenase [Colletotrichum tofieldiae]